MTAQEITHSITKALDFPIMEKLYQWTINILPTDNIGVAMIAVMSLYSVVMLAVLHLIAKKNWRIHATVLANTVFCLTQAAVLERMTYIHGRLNSAIETTLTILSMSTEYRESFNGIFGLTDPSNAEIAEALIYTPRASWRVYEQTTDEIGFLLEHLNRALSDICRFAGINLLLPLSKVYAAPILILLVCIFMWYFYSKLGKPDVTSSALVAASAAMGYYLPAGYLMCITFTAVASSAIFTITEKKSTIKRQ